MSVHTKGLIMDIIGLTWAGCITLVVLAGTALVLRVLYREWRERERREDEE